MTSIKKSAVVKKSAVTPKAKTGIEAVKAGKKAEKKAKVALVKKPTTSKLDQSYSKSKVKPATLDQSYSKSKVKPATHKDFGIAAVAQALGVEVNVVRYKLKQAEVPKTGHFYDFKNATGVARIAKQLSKKVKK